MIAALALALFAAAPSAEALSPPALRLPSGVVPLRGELELSVDPAAERNAGTVATRSGSTRRRR
ncbi:MAG: hypothetical protein QM767_22740 [Anaeromyxobacter sp.]